MPRGVVPVQETPGRQWVESARARHQRGETLSAEFAMANRVVGRQTIQEISRAPNRVNAAIDEKYAKLVVIPSLDEND